MTAALVERFFAEVINAHEPADDGLLHPDFTMFTAAVPEGKQVGPDGFLAVVRGNHAAFPDWTATVEQMLVDGDTVATRWTARGTHRGKFQDLGPTGRAVLVRGCYWNSVRNGLIAEHRNFTDMLGFRAQLTA